MTASPFLDEILLRTRRGVGKTSVGPGKMAGRSGWGPAGSETRSRADRLWKSLASTGGAFVKRIPGGGVQHSRQLAGQLAYVNGKAKGTFGFATGVETGREAFEQADLDQVIAAWSQDWNGRPRNGHTSHIVLSFPDDVSQNAAFLIAQEWCAEMFESETHVEDTWEHVAVLHTDKANPHVHVILNNRGLGGTWFSMSARSIFDPQMMRDRMTDIAEDYGVHLESLTRADRGLYGPPITSSEVFAAREGRVLNTGPVETGLTAAWRKEDMRRTAELYTILADFAVTIGAPIIAKRAYLAASSLFAGEEIPKGKIMEIELNVTADREDIRTSLISWAEENGALIDALPEAERTEIMGKIDAALTIIETDITPDLTEDTIWTAFKARPSSYLIPDVGALEDRAALHLDGDNADLLHEFMNENVLDTYLVTGEVPDRFAAVLPAVADAYEEMHSHQLDEIPKAMKGYVKRGEGLGLDRQDFEDRLINTVDGVEENTNAERNDIARIVEKRLAQLSDPVAVARASSDYHDFQLALGEVEEKIIADSKVYDRTGVARLLQDAASTAATTGRADLADSAVGRHVLTAFVALEGRGAMQDLASGNMDPLADYVDTPAHQRLAAKELLRSAKSLDVGLDPDQIERGLEAVDPTYSRGRGHSI